MGGEEGWGEGQGEVGAGEVVEAWWEAGQESRRGRGPRHCEGSLGLSKFSLSQELLYPPFSCPSFLPPLLLLSPTPPSLAGYGQQALFISCVQDLADDRRLHL